MMVPVKQRVDGVDALLQVAWDLFHGKVVTSRYIREQYGVSRATAYRYLLILQTSIPGLSVSGGERRGDAITVFYRRALAAA